MNVNEIKIKCVEVTQPFGTFYVGKIGWEDLLEIAYSDIRRIQSEEAGNIESYLGIQRELSPKRLKEIANYVSYKDATFPSSIVLSINSIDEESDESNITSYDKTTGILTLKRNKNIAQIIDGQHRVFGIREYVKNNSLLASEFNFELIITMFIDIDPDDQSMIFSTINKAQTKVNKSLVYDLYDLAKTRSPQRTAHNIVKFLDDKDGSPLKGMIKRLGKADDPERETITQATLVESIIKYISSDEMKDRDLLKRGKSLPLITEKDLKKKFFRNWFIEEKDAYITKVLWNYFSAIKRRWSDGWEKQTILVKSTGIIAFMKFLSPLVNHLGIERVISEDEFYSVLSKINITTNDFNTQKYVPGATGISDLVKDLKEKSGLN